MAVRVLGLPSGGLGPVFFDPVHWASLAIGVARTWGSPGLRCTLPGTVNCAASRQGQSHYSQLVRRATLPGPSALDSR